MSDRYIIAIDIGTTNIEAALVRVGAEVAGAADAGHGSIGDTCKLYEPAHEIMSTILRPNVNRKFGRDVMTRITQAERGNLHQMSIDLRDQLSEIIGELSDGVDIIRIVIACNTTMTHILLEEDCHNLGVYPFSPVHTEQVDIMSNDLGIGTGSLIEQKRSSLDTGLFGTDSAGSQVSHPVPITVLPGFSAYVGGDIMAGVISLDLIARPGRSLLIDLGTNGEMVYHDQDSGKILVTSAAAGPAFELAGRAKATEIIEGIAHLRDSGIIDETGLLTDEYFDNGYRYGKVNITQQLIRDVQTAKSAIRTGIEILLGRAGVGTGDIDNVFLSGAFGDNLDISAAVSIGMLPEAFSDRVRLCGNTSLSGAIRVGLCSLCEAAGAKHSGVNSAALLIEENGLNGSYSFIQGHKPSFEEIYLANEDEFNELYIENMGL